MFSKTLFPTASMISLRSFYRSEMYLATMESGEIWVLKKSEHPFLEAMAAEIPQIARLGVHTLPTKITYFNPKNDIVNQQNLSSHYETHCFLQMPYQSGVTFSNAKFAFENMSIQKQKDRFFEMGSLYAFDILIDNSDRLVKGANMSNVLLSTQEKLIGIDQKIGLALVSQKSIAEQIITKRLLPMAESKTRKEYIMHIWLDIYRDIGRKFMHDPMLFCKAFEEGFLQTTQTIAHLKTDKLIEEIDKHTYTYSKSSILNNDTLYGVLDVFKHFLS